jgi:arylsulfatase I/J
MRRHRALLLAAAVAAAAAASDAAASSAATTAVAAAVAGAAAAAAAPLQAAPASPSAAPRPHIVFIFVDDYGYNNIGYHAASNNASAEILTPRLDELAAAGVKLERQYVFRFCSPTRSAFHTGRNPIHVNVLNSDLAAANLSDPISGFAGIPRNMTALPARLKEAGYRTIASGKWHVGLATRDHLPKGRGYDESLVYLDGANGYWNDACTGWCSPPSDPYEPTTDLWLNDGPAYGLNASWACTDKTQGASCVYEDELLTDFAVNAIDAHDAAQPLFLYFSPHAVHVSASGLVLEVPAAQLARFDFMCAGDNSSGCNFRQRYAAITNLVDAYIGRVVDALKAKGMWDNTLLVLSADNGGLAIANGFGGGNNFPLRGGKISNLEGGVRVNAFASGGFIPPARRGSVEHGFIEVADWLATFCALAGVDPHDARAAAAGLPPIDSLDMSALILGANATSPREEVVIGADTDDGNDGATLVQGVIRASDGMKLLVGTVQYSGWQGPLFPNATTRDGQDASLDCGNVTHPLCLFDVLEDPTEHVNLAAARPDVAAALALRVAALQKTVFSPRRGPSLADFACNHSNAVFGGFVGPFLP